MICLCSDFCWFQQNEILLPFWRLASRKDSGALKPSTVATYFWEGIWADVLGLRSQQSAVWSQKILGLENRGCCVTQQRLPAQKHTKNHAVSPPQRLEALKHFLCKWYKFADYSQERFLEIILKEWKVTEQGGHNSPNWIIKKKIKKCAKFEIDLWPCFED